ncbi:EamA family transporter [Lysinibacillus sp. KCTC 33748]|uniref:DMT family transporter n=1 Tax=Lysinibacillus zambalensis TaxID=3160866 RepID=A0ABV1MWJ8_9BACI|nr:MULTISPECIES: DMT family transporter [unclassified Lysinibacillus]OXS74166.1 EamA family transporter [Lysinibacillus sp. KCTC 33748]SKB72670.1 EamA domain-containing membrane protein RarD [Lysinibacillus sp. AC-3]
MEKPKIHPYIPIFIGVISVSLSAIFVKLANAEAGVIAFYRMLFSVLIMAPLFFWKYTNEVKQLRRRDWLFSSVAGIFLAFHFILWFESLNYTSVASSTVLVTLQPLFAFVGTYFFFKESITLKTILAGAIAIVGSILISWGDFKLSGTAFYGDMLALIACALVTAYFLFGQDVRKRLSLVTYTMLVYAVSTITLFIYVLIKGESFGPYPTMDWIWFILLAIVPNLLGHTLFNWSIKYVSTNVVSIAILFEPIGAAILALFIFKEYLIATQIIGGLIVIVGILLFVVDEKKIFKLFSKKA